MANPMHCDAQRNALGLSLQSIACFHAPNCTEIFKFVPRCTGRTKIRDSQRVRGFGDK